MISDHKNPPDQADATTINQSINGDHNPPIPR